MNGDTPDNLGMFDDHVHEFVHRCDHAGSPCQVAQSTPVDNGYPQSPVAHTPQVWAQCTIIGTTPADAPTSNRGLTKSTPAPAKTRGVSMAGPQHKTDPRPQIKPDDHRHGTKAGVMAHWRSGIELCEPCRFAQYRENKAAKMRRDHGVLNRIPLGQAAWDVVAGCTRTQLHHATGLNRNMLSRLYKGGPELMVLRSTRDRVLASRVQFTPLGIQRRLQALAVIGYSSEFIADKVQTHPSTLNRLRRGPVSFVRHDYALRVVEMYEALHMTPINIPVSSAAARTHAQHQGWLAPLAWDDIDRDPTPTRATSTTAVDEIKVQRVLDGIKADCNPAERMAVLEAWKGSQAELQRITGWNISRLLRSVA